MSESGRLGELGEVAEEAERAGLEGGLQAFEEQTSVKPREHAHGRKEAGAAGDPTCSVQRRPAAGRDAVDVRMMMQVLAPGVEHGHEADLGSRMLGVRGDRAQSLGRRLEENAVDDRLVLEGDLGDRRGHGEDDVAILRRQQFGLPLGEPLGARQALTLRTMSVATGIVGLPGEAAVRALFDMAAQGRRPAGLDRAHHSVLDASDVAVMRLAIGGAVAAEHVRHLHRRAHREVGSSGRRDPQPRVVERADRVGDGDGRHLGIARRGRQIAVPEQDLDDTDVGPVLQQMGRDPRVKPGE